MFFFFVPECKQRKFSHIQLWFNKFLMNFFPVSSRWPSSAPSEWRFWFWLAPFLNTTSKFSDDSLLINIWWFSLLTSATPCRWWPFFTVLFYLACPLPTMISKRQNYDNSSCLELSIFLTVGIILSSFALPVVLCLAGTIAVGACVLNVLGNVVVYFTLFGFFLGKIWNEF